MCIFSFPFCTQNGACIHAVLHLACFFFKKRSYLFIFREREGREEERERKHHCVVASCAPSTGDLACNPSMCPDWESNQ